MKLPFLTEEERAKPMSHYAEGLTFTCERLDLSAPVTVTHHAGINNLNFRRLAPGITCFMAWWLLNIRPRLNGFSGVDTIKWEF